MFWSKLFIPTLRENSRSSILERAGYLRPIGAGAHAWLVLGRLSISKIQGIVRCEMEAIGGQEMLFPSVDPSEDMLAIGRGALKPQVWYQITTRVHACSFGIDAADAWSRIFDRCGLSVVTVDGAFMVPDEQGDSRIAACGECDYRASFETATSRAGAPEIGDPDTNEAPERFETPGIKTISALAEFTGLPRTSQMKSLVMVADGEPILALLRGDHQLSAIKLARFTGESEVRQARADEIGQWFGADPGSLGPVGVSNIRVVADLELQGRRNMIAGANQNDYHLRNVTPGRDFQADFADLRLVNKDDRCASCGGELKFLQGIQVGRVSDGAYEMDLERILSCIAEQNRDDAGLVLPAPIAPFHAIVMPVNNADPAQREAARGIYDEGVSRGIDILYDDRDERAGVKFKDAELIGVPWRITIGKKLAEGLVELTSRKGNVSRDVAQGEVVKELQT
jgi:prolyl-tRNA synthetase